MIRCSLALLLLSFSVSAGAKTWCTGTTAEPAKRLEILTSAAGAAPYVTLSPDDAKGAWLIDYGATASSVNRLGNLSASDPRWVGTDRKQMRLRRFDFPYESANQEVANLPRAISEDGVGLQHGVIGTDVLGKHTVELHYEDPREQHLLVSKPGCVLSDQGFFQILQAGYFGSKPDHHSVQGVNVPVVFTSFERADGTFSASKIPAQLDTGMADTVWPRTVYVNEALWTKINTAKAVRIGILGVNQCDGSTNLEVWALPDTQLQVTDQTGFWLTKYPAHYIVPLKQIPVSSECGGIATMTTPAAQIGASFLRSFGTVVIDPAAFPNGGAVWIKMPQAPTQ